MRRYYAAGAPQRARRRRWLCCSTPTCVVGTVVALYAAAALWAGAFAPPKDDPTPEPEPLPAPHEGAAEPQRASDAESLRAADAADVAAFRERVFATAATTSARRPTRTPTRTGDANSTRDAAEVSGRRPAFPLANGARYGASASGWLAESVNPTTSATLSPEQAGAWPRIFCLVPTQFNWHARELMDAILSTWGPQCDVLKFYIDPTPHAPRYFRARNSDAWAELVQVDMKRKSGDSICADGSPCRHIWEKVWRSWVHVADHDLDSADWFCKIDDDSLFIPANLRRFVARESGGWSPDDARYFGHRFSRPDGDRIVSGVLSAFSRETVRRMAAVFREMPHEYGPRHMFRSGRCVDRDGATEERTTALCLKGIGIHAESARDAAMRERVLPLGLPFTVTYPRKTNTTGWYWHHKPRETPDMHLCCAPDMWGSHGYKVAARLVSAWWRLTQRDLAESRVRVGLPERQPDAWDAQERELYELAAVARGSGDAWFRDPLRRAAASRRANHGFDLEPDHRGEWWYSWFILLLRASLRHNPFDRAPPSRGPPPDGAVLTTDRRWSPEPDAVRGFIRWG